jgi:hypothetical protein
MGRIIGFVSCIEGEVHRIEPSSNDLWRSPDCHAKIWWENAEQELDEDQIQEDYHHHRTIDFTTPYDGFPLVVVLSTLHWVLIWRTCPFHFPIPVKIFRTFVVRDSLSFITIVSS